jgi:SnoaL-like domain
MNTLTTLTESEVKQLVDDWYLKLDVHAPIDEVLPLLAGETLEMQLPETTLHGLDGFSSWYDRVINTFFDEVHTLQTLDITIDGDRADVQLVVRWEASRWNAPAPKSERLAFDAAQRWVVVRSPQTQQPAIVTYIVDSLTPLPGFPNL